MKTALKPVAIGEVVDRAQTWNPSRSSADEVFQYIDLSAVDQDAKLITGAREVSCGEAPSRARQIVENGDILVSTVRPNLNGVASVPGELDGATASTGFCVLRASKTKASSAYLFHWVKSPMFIADMVSKATGASYPAVSDRIIFESQIPLPPLAEQKRIAAVLDAADALRAKRREALAQLDALLQSTFLTLFGDPKEGVPIGELVESKMLLLHKDGNHGGLYPRAEEFGTEGIPFISAKCISDSGELIADEVQFLGEKKARTLRLGWILNGDVLLAHNASVGKTHLYRGNFTEALIGTSLTSFRPNPKFLDSCYLLGALRSTGFQAQLFSNMGQTTRNQVPITAQRRLTIPVPPLPLQQKFAAIVESIERQKTTQRAHLAELDALFAALQHRAFRGEL